MRSLNQRYIGKADQARRDMNDGGDSMLMSQRSGEGGE